MQAFLRDPLFGPHNWIKDEQICGAFRDIVEQHTPNPLRVGIIAVENFESKLYLLRQLTHDLNERFIVIYTW